MEMIPPPVPPGLEGRETVPPPEDQLPPGLPDDPLLEDPLLEDPLLEDPLLEDPLLEDPLLVEEVPFLYPVQEVEHEAYLAQ